MDNAGVADINFWRFDETFSSVGVERRQAPDEEQVRQQVTVAVGGLGADHHECGGQARRVEQTALSVSQHDPKTLQGFSWNSRSKEGKFAFQIGTDKVLPPAKAVAVVRNEKTVWKTAAYPKGSQIPIQGL